MDNSRTDKLLKECGYNFDLPPNSFLTEEPITQEQFEEIKAKMNFISSVERQFKTNV